MQRSVRDIATLRSLDSDEILAGYHDGLAGEPEPGDNRSLGYWHGWRNGAVDSGRREKDEEQALLAHLILRKVA